MKHTMYMKLNLNITSEMEPRENQEKEVYWWGNCPWLLNFVVEERRIGVDDESRGHRQWREES